MTQDMTPHPQRYRSPNRLAMLVEYEGTRYHGFQFQHNAISIQEQLEKAICKLTGKHTRVNAAGRTDTGVHATGQVVAFDDDSNHEPSVFMQGLNHYLPQDIRIRNAKYAPMDFNPRKWATSREYRYRLIISREANPLFRRFVHNIKRPLDLDVMQIGASSIEGIRDFAPFSGQAVSGSTIRELFECSINSSSNIITIKLIANAFLKQQVRRTVGALLELGLGNITLQEFDLLSECSVVGASIWVAPPHGLVLTKVNYREESFLTEDVTSANALEMELGSLV